MEDIIFYLTTFENILLTCMRNRFPLLNPGYVHVYIIITINAFFTTITKLFKFINLK